MVLNPGQLPPPALRLALPRASSHAAPGDAERVFPGALRRVRPHSPHPQPAPCQGVWITHKESPQNCLPGRLSRGELQGPSSVRTPRNGVREAARLRLPTPAHAGLGRLCARRGGSEPRGVCLCAEERAISQNSFSPFYFFFSLYFVFPRRLLRGCLA